jgi:DNA-binding transcriptional LysR family regulator
MPFSLSLLRVFVAVAHRQSFTRAAEQLGLTQPAVSKSVRELERQAGTPLVERIPTGVRLTEAGAVLLGHARAILAEERAADDAMHALRGLGRGSLRIGASPTIATYLLPTLIQAFSVRHPAIELHLHTAQSRAVATALLERELDLGFAEAPVADDPRLEVSQWLDDEMVVVAAPSHALAPQAPIAIRTLANELLVLREPGSGMRKTVLDMLQARDVVPNRTMDADSVESMKRLVAAGLGVSIISRAAIEDMLALRRLVVLDTVEGPMTRPLTRLALRHGQSAAAKAFVQLLLPDAAESARSASRLPDNRAAERSRRDHHDGADGTPSRTATPSARRPARTGTPGRGRR